MTTLPQSAANLQAERAILAAILCAADFDFSHLAPEEFSLPLHRRLYARMRTMRAESEPINVLAVIEPMRLDDVERSAVHELHSPLYGPFTPQNLSSYVRLVKRDAGHRELLRACGTLLTANGDIPLRVLEVQAQSQRYLSLSAPGAFSVLGSCSTAELLTAQEKSVEWMCWPFAAAGLVSIVDALPKVGKTVLFQSGILSSREHRPFLGFPTKPMRVIYVSEQSRASLCIQAREVGFTGEEPIEELRWITREDWSRHVYTDFLTRLEKEILEPGAYNSLLIDTFHTIARLEDENDAAEVNRLGNLTIDVATRNNLALTIGRHDRKSGGEIGLSGRGTGQLSGLVDVILHLVRGDNATQRRLELAGRVPGLPSALTIELRDREYLNWGEPSEAKAEKEAASLDAMLQAEPTLGYRTIAERMAISKNRVKQIAKTAGWSKDEESGLWSKAS